MTTTIVITLPDPVAAQVDTMAGKAGMSPGGWLSDQIVFAYGSGRVCETTAQPRRTHRGRSRVKTETADA